MNSDGRKRRGGQESGWRTRCSSSAMPAGGAVLAAALLSPPGAPDMTQNKMTGPARQAGLVAADGFPRPSPPRPAVTNGETP